MSQHVVSPKVYYIVFIVLMALLGLTVAFSYIDLGRHWNDLLALAIACVKALLVAVFFMHLRYGSRLSWFFALAGVVWLGMLIVLSSSEYLTRNHPPGVNPKGEPTYLQPSQ